MKKNDIWLFSMIALLILSKTTHNKIFAIAGILNAILVLYNVGIELWGMYRD